MKQKIINIVVTLIIILATTLIAPVLLLLEGYNTLKMWALLAGGAILFVLLLFNIKNFKLDKKDILLLIFLGLAVISTILSSNLKVSIWGQRNRHEGLLMFFSYAMLYFTCKKFYNYENKKELLNILFYTFMAIGIIGIIQRYVTKGTINLFGTVYNVKRWYPIFNKQVNGTFGNSNFFGSFITIVLPISSYLFLTKGSKKAFILSLVMFFNLISCTARSAWVAFIIGSIFFLIFLIKQKNKTYFKRTMVLLVCFIIIGTYLFGGFNTIKTKIENVKKQKIVQTEAAEATNTKPAQKVVPTESQRKIAQIEREVKEATNSKSVIKMGSGRIPIWKMTLKLITKKPIFGCGPDNLNDGLHKYCEEEVVDYFENHKVEVDKAHNEYLQIGATLGIPALIVYLSFLSLILFPKMKIMFEDKTMFIFVVAIICYLVQGFFNISTIGIAPLFWIILGLSDNKKMFIF